MIKKVVTLSIVFYCFFIHPGSADSIPSNRELAVRLLIEPALEQIHHYAPPSNDATALLLLPNESGTELSRWFGRNLIDSCVAQNYAVYVRPNNTLDSVIIVEISQPDITFQYRSAGRRWVLFNTGYKRRVKSKFHLSIKNHRGQVLFSQHFDDTFEDRITDIEKIEDNDLMFTQGKKLGSSIGKRLIEPFLVTAATVTMVYLFYSLRSGK